MQNTALFLLTGNFRFAIETIGQYLKNVNKSVSKCLYIKLETDLSNPFLKSNSSCLHHLSSFVPLVYSQATSVLKNVDVRLILNNINFANKKSLDFDIVLTNCNCDDSIIKDYVLLNFNSKCGNVIKLNCGEEEKEQQSNLESSEFKTFKTVVLGGTFDRLHNGHKVLLTESVLRCTKKLIVGISTGTLLKNKVLSELIEPVEKRIADVSNFLCEIDASLEYEVVPIIDPYGPAVTNPDIDCIVVTTETRIGGQKVNIEREKRDMTELYMYVVDLVENVDHSVAEEEKLSSSTQRMHLLGAPLKYSKVSSISSDPLIILFQGHLASDKNIIAQRFQSLGVVVLCCDQICHSILEKSKDLQKLILCTFPDVHDVSFDNIRIKCLQKKDFKDWLTEKIYHKVKSALKQVMDIYLEKGGHTILIKESTLFEGYDLEINYSEMWSSILPATEVIKRLKADFNLSEDDAASAVQCLPSNHHYVRTANVLFCNQWSLDYTQIQIDRAMAYIKSIRDLK